MNEVNKKLKPDIRIIVINSHEHFDLAAVHVRECNESTSEPMSLEFVLKE